MDLLFSRYADPFLFINGMIKSGRFCFFVSSFLKQINGETEEKALWEFYLHRVFEGSFADFRAGIENDKHNRLMSETAMETTLIKTFNGHT